VYRLLNKVEQNYSTTQREVLVMIFSLHKFVFYVDHMALVYLVNKPQVLGIIIKWLLIFLEYDFIVVYKLGKTHVITDALSRLPDSTKPACAPNQTIDASLFYTRLEWLNDVKEFLKTKQIVGMLSM
jgi:hypothetical protein